MDSTATVPTPTPTVGPPPREVIDESVHAPAGPALQPYVAWYSGYRQAGIAPSVHRGLPSPHLTLIFTLDDPLTLISHPDPNQPPTSYDTLLGGLHSSPAIISQPGRQSGIQLALDPLSTRALLGVPAGELAETVIPADALLGRFCAELRERLGSAATWQDRFGTIDRLLPRVAREYGAVPPEVVRAWHLLLSTGGRIPVAALAREVGWSERHLSGRFRTEIGMTPKAAARVIRFDRACTLLATRVGRGPHRGRETQHARAGRVEQIERANRVAALDAHASHADDTDRADSTNSTNSTSHADRADYPNSTGRAATPGHSTTAPSRPTRPDSHADLAAPATTRLADLAAECGYFDQAHLARDFRALAGCAPTEWLAAEFRNVQAADPDPAADWS